MGVWSPGTGTKGKEQITFQCAKTTKLGIICENMGILSQSKTFQMLAMRQANRI